MHYVLLVHILQTRKHLLHYISDDIAWQSFSALLGTISLLILIRSHEVKHCAFDELKDEVDVAFGADHLFKFYDIRMVELPECDNLSKAHRFIPALKLFFHFLYGNCLSSLDHLRFINCAIGAIATTLDDLKFIHI